jgi:hypothetical protein
VNALEKFVKNTSFKYLKFEINEGIFITLINIHHLGATQAKYQPSVSFLGNITDSKRENGAAVDRN